MASERRREKLEDKIKKDKIRGKEIERICVNVCV